MQLARFSNSLDRKSTRLNSSHLGISYAVFCLKKTVQVTGWVGAWAVHTGPVASATFGGPCSGGALGSGGSGGVGSVMGADCAPCVFFFIAGGPSRLSTFAPPAALPF